jgi:hypothetical protein
MGRCNEQTADVDANGSIARRSVEFPSKVAKDIAQPAMTVSGPFAYSLVPEQIELSAAFMVTFSDFRDPPARAWMAIK